VPARDGLGLATEPLVMTSDVGHRSHDSGSGSSDTSASLVTSQFGLVVKGRTMATAIANRRVGDDRCEERDHQRKYQISSEYGGTLRLNSRAATNTASDAHSGISRTCGQLTPQICVRHTFATRRCRATVLHKTIM
jgi:hypothetical protein